MSVLKPVCDGGQGAGLVAKLTRPVLNGVSVRVIGIRLGLQLSKSHDKHGNANGENLILQSDTVCDFWADL